MLSEGQCVCTTLYRSDPQQLLWVLDHLAAGTVVNQIAVPSDIQAGAMLSLERMLDAGRSEKPPVQLETSAA